MFFPLDQRIKLFILTVLLLVGTIALPATVEAGGNSSQFRCPPTAEDEMGPFYRPEAPLRSRIGSGYLLQGEVRTATTCQPVPSARIEFWQAGPNGHYGDEYRATVIADRQGRYQLETDAPPPYVSRPPHIHVRVSAEGYTPLVTQHYLQPGEQAAVFDLVLVPAE